MQPTVAEGVAESLAYLNGSFVPFSQARLPVFDAGIVLGATVTEMTRTFGGAPFRLEDHIRRLFASLRYTRIAVNETPAQLVDIARELAERNRVGLDPHDDLGIIHFITAGPVRIYAGLMHDGPPVGPTVCVHTFPLPFEMWARKMEHGAHLVTPSIRNVPPQCVDPKMKCRSRMHYYLADQEARLVEPDALALLLDVHGNVTETSGGNFLVMSDGVLRSPPPTNILEGISRDTVLALARELGVPVEERDLQVHTVLNADEAFITTTPYCVMPVTKVNGVPIGDDRPGPFHRRLLDRWSQRVGVDIRAQIIDGAARRRPG